jgi:hypothetical protein
MVAGAITFNQMNKPDYSKKEMTWRYQRSDKKYRTLYIKDRDTWVIYSSTPFRQPDTHGFGGWPTYQHLISIGWKVVHSEEKQ